MRGLFTLLQGYFAPTLSIDEQTMYIAGGPGDGRHFIIKAIHRKGAGWTKPEIYLKANFGLYDYMPTRSGTAYVGSNARQGNLNNFDTYNFCSLRIKGTDTLIKSLGDAYKINNQLDRQKWLMKKAAQLRSRLII